MTMTRRPPPDSLSQSLARLAMRPMHHFVPKAVLPLSQKAMTLARDGLHQEICDPLLFLFGGSLIPGSKLKRLFTEANVARVIVSETAASAQDVVFDGFYYNVFVELSCPMFFLSAVLGRCRARLQEVGLSCRRRCGAQAFLGVWQRRNYL